MAKNAIEAIQQVEKKLTKSKAAIILYLIVQKKNDWQKKIFSL